MGIFYTGGFSSVIYSVKRALDCQFRLDTDWLTHLLLSILTGMAVRRLKTLDEGVSILKVVMEQGKVSVGNGTRTVPGALANRHNNWLSSRKFPVSLSLELSQGFMSSALNNPDSRCVYYFGLFLSWRRPLAITLSWHMNCQVWGLQSVSLCENVRACPEAKAMSRYHLPLQDSVWKPLNCALNKWSLGRHTLNY